MTDHSLSSFCVTSVALHEMDVVYPVKPWSCEHVLHTVHRCGMHEMEPKHVLRHKPCTRELDSRVWLLPAGLLSHHSWGAHYKGKTGRPDFMWSCTICWHNSKAQLKHGAPLRSGPEDSTHSMMGILPHGSARQYTWSCWRRKTARGIDLQCLKPKAWLNSKELARNEAEIWWQDLQKRNMDEPFKMGTSIRILKSSEYIVSHFEELLNQGQGEYSLSVNCLPKPHQSCSEG